MINLIFLLNIIIFLSVAKVIKSIKNIFKKVLANEKRLCIFALGFTGR